MVLLCFAMYIIYIYGCVPDRLSLQCTSFCKSCTVHMCTERIQLVYHLFSTYKYIHICVQQLEYVLPSLTLA